MSLIHKEFLLRALELAEKGRGRTAPNPAVGAVIVRDGAIVGEGYHSGAGLPHAEVEALQGVEDARGAVAYVTLEPCCHFGKTPPCTDLLVHRGIQEVVFAVTDPNPVVAGKGKQALEAAGIPCQVLPVTEIELFYRSYRHWTETKLPFVTAKLAMTLDGKIAGAGGERRKITSEALDRIAHEGRRRTDAILTTAETVVKDDPQLNARVDGISIAKPIYVLDRQGRVPASAKIFETAASVTIFRPATGKPLGPGAARIIEMPLLSDHNFNLSPVLKFIGSEGKHDLWVEAGGRLFESLATGGHLNQGFLYVSEESFGDQALDAFRDPDLDIFGTVKRMTWKSYGREAICEMVW